MVGTRIDMITFKQYILEGAVGRQPNFKDLDIDQAIDIFKKNCKKSLPNLEHNHVYYKGFHDVTMPNLCTVNTTDTERESENTLNYYTVILDNNPMMSAFPKRSRSFVCTTNKETAHGYGNVFVVIPFDDCKIGAVNKEDIWRSRPNLYNEASRINVFNELFHFLKIEPTIEGFKKFDQNVKDKESEEYHLLNKHFPDVGDGYKHFLKDIWKAYSPKELGFSVIEPGDVNTMGEVWIAGKVLLIHIEDWSDFREMVT
jgi:hypothetical protein